LPKIGVAADLVRDLLPLARHPTPRSATQPPRRSLRGGLRGRESGSVPRRAGYRPGLLRGIT